jgi:hypothetical protein
MQLARARISGRSRLTPIDALLGEAEVELLAGDATASAEAARQALNRASSLQTGVPYSLRTGRSWLILGRALQMLGDHAKAHEAFAAAVSHLSNTVDADHPDLLEARRLASTPRTGDARSASS